MEVITAGITTGITRVTTGITRVTVGINTVDTITNMGRITRKPLFTGHIPSRFAGSSIK
jgi:hypothetical protein